MKPPFILWIKDENLAEVFDSAEELVGDVESPDVDDGNYSAFDSEGRLLELVVDRPGPPPRRKRFGWVSIEPVFLRSLEAEPSYQGELRLLLERTLRAVGRETVPSAELSVEELIEQVKDATGRIRRRQCESVRQAPAGARLMVAVLFVIYLLSVIRLAVIPHAFSLRAPDVTGFWLNHNLVPLRGYTWEQAIGNLLLLMPLGFGVPFLGRMTRRSAVLIGVVVALGIELLQLLVWLFMGGRTVDVTDILFNAIGYFIGLAFFEALRRLYTRFFSRRQPPASWRRFHEILIHPWPGEKGPLTRP